jgi:adenylate cyclase
MERKLAAILSADVKGYSRLMGEDELATVRTLTAYREVLTTLIQAHRGRVVDSPGDNLLAEFASVVDAVQCATEIQQDLAVRNAALPAHRQMAFRIGINVSDVLTDDGRLYGDGVNIAARLEGLAEAGGICLSDTAYTQVKNKLTLAYEYIGEQQVKNIAEPVRVWRIKTESEGGSSAGEADSPRSQSQGPTSILQGPKTRGVGTVRWSRIVLVGLFLATSLATSLYFALPALRDQPTLALPLKPSIAVLPFVNMSADPTQDYFSDGMTDTLITDLSKLAGLFVIARNSTFVYKGKAIKPQQVSQELGVRYVLEGSVQKAEARVRIIVQLVDAATGHHLWAERYDRELKDIFTLQDELTRRVVGALQVKLTTQEQGRLGRVPTENLAAYDYYLRGKEYWERATQEANGQARQLFEHAIALDPQFALAYTGLGLTYLREWLWGWSYDPHTLDQAVELAQKARALDDTLPEAHTVLGLAFAWS